MAARPLLVAVRQVVVVPPLVLAAVLAVRRVSVFGSKLRRIVCARL